MRYQQRVTVLPKKSNWVAIEPPTDEVPVQLLFLHAEKSLLVNDIKVGKNSQLASAGPFRSDMLADMELRLDRTHDSLHLTVDFYNDHNEEVSGELHMLTISSVDANPTLALPLGFCDEIGRDPKYKLNMTQEPIAPGETRNIIARTQVGGLVKRVLFSKKIGAEGNAWLNAVIRPRTLPFRGESLQSERTPVAGLRGFATRVRLDPGDALLLEVTNEFNVPISAQDFACSVENVDARTGASADWETMQRLARTSGKPS